MIIIVVTYLSVIFFSFIIFHNNIIEINRRNIISVAILVYISIIFLEQYYLENIHGMSFQISDPTFYYLKTKDLDFQHFIDFIITDEDQDNFFYLFLNWIYQSGIEDPTFYAIAIKITNAMVFLLAYLFFFKDSTKKVSYIDLVLLFHPWLIYILIRNIRDSYIILFTSLLIHLSFKKKYNVTDIISISLILSLMSVIRPFFIAPMLLILLARIFNLSTNKQRKTLMIFISAIALIFLFIYKDTITYNITKYFMGNLIFFQGENAVDNVEQLYSDNIDSKSINTDLLNVVLSKVTISIPVFLFTPHPYNWFNKYLEFRENGMYGIYTDFDNVLIIAGSLINYVMIYPLFFKFIVNIRKVNISFILITFFILVMYSVFLLGNADMRIRYTYIFFMVIGFHKSGLTLYKTRSDFNYLLASMIIFLSIPFIIIT